MSGEKLAVSIFSYRPQLCCMHACVCAPFTCPCHFLTLVLVQSWMSPLLILVLRTILQSLSQQWTLLQHNIFSHSRKPTSGSRNNQAHDESTKKISCIIHFYKVSLFSFKLQSNFVLYSDFTKTITSHESNHWCFGCSLLSTVGNNLRMQAQIHSCPSRSVFVQMHKLGYVA